jgi:hypothetical protein
MTRSVWFVAVALLLPALTHAQSTDPTPASFAVDAGEKVIVTVGGASQAIRGRVVRIGLEGLVLDEGRTRRAVPLADVQRVERQKDRFWDGALKGYGAGFAVGAVMVLANPCERDPNVFIDMCFDGPAFAVAVGGLITGPAGFAIGGIADAIKRKPRAVFERVASDRVAIAVAPALARRGAGIRVAVAF